MNTTDIYYKIKDTMDRLGADRVPHYVNFVMPDKDSKDRVIAYAKRLGLTDTDNTGTYRLWQPYPDGSRMAAQYPSMGSEIYLHTDHVNGYPVADHTLLLSLGVYGPSSRALSEEE
jgi:hypothetical protein